MHPLRYNALVARLERLAAERPGALRLRVTGLVALGYLYVAVVLLALLTGIALLGYGLTSGNAVGALKLLVILLALAWMIVRSLWVRAVPPAGLPIAPGSAPALEKRLEEVRTALRAPKAHTILVTEDWNASVMQLPRLGIFGWPRTYLTLGLPLLYALDARHLDAVLAHEFAHLSGAHPKRGLWVHRMSRTWQQLFTTMREQPAGRMIFFPFFRWYVPRLYAHGFVMSRRDEYEADAEAAALVGRQTMAEALAILEIGGHAIDEWVWPSIWRQAREIDAPPSRAWSTVAGRLRHEIAPAQHAAWLGHALRRVATEDDTHPSLAERLRALGADDLVASEDVAARLAPSAQTSAAEQYLGPLAPALLADVDKRWHESAVEGWKERHEELQVLHARAEELRRKDAEAPLEPAELWELTNAVMELDDERTAIPLLQRVVVAMPKHAAGHFMLGRALLAGGDAAGIASLRASIALDAESRGPALELMRRHYVATGDRVALESVQVEQHGLQQTLAGALDERGDVKPRDLLAPAVLDDETRARVVELLRARPGVTAAWIARKVTHAMPERPMYVVLVERPTPWWKRSTGDDRRLAQEMLGDLSAPLPGDLLVIVHQATTRWLQKKMRAVAGASLLAA